MKRSIFLLASLTLLACACKDNTKQEIIQDDKHWVVLDVHEAREQGGKLQWSFTLKRKGSYNVQLICDGELSSPLSEICLETGETVMKEVP